MRPPSPGSPALSTSRPAPAAPVDLGPPSLLPLPSPGAWIYACREGAERDLAEELVLSSKEIGPRLLAPALLSTRRAPRRRDRRIDLAFARQAFPLAAALVGSSTAELADRAVEALRRAVGARDPFTLQTFVPDSDTGNRLAQPAAALHRGVEERLDRDASLAARRGRDPRATGGLLVQLCLVEPDIALLGALPAAEALSSRPGGRARIGRGRAAPSRAAMKLEEALEWLGVGPEPGDRCVDLGAAPGGWTWVLAERRAHVTAVDPGRLAPDLARRRNVAYVRASAFDFVPEEPVDWLFCDMAWRPLEVAALLARWGRNRWARTLVANVKLPMKRKAEMLRRVREIVESGGWRDVRARQLYHDRDEITLTAWSR